MISHKNKKQTSGKSPKKIGFLSALTENILSKGFALSLCGAILFSAVGPSLGFLLEDDQEWGSMAVAGGAGGGAVDAGASKSEMDFGQIASFLVSIAVPLIAFEVGMIGSLMSNEFILGKGGSDSVGDGHTASELLRKMWQVVRDLINYLFILILLLIAFLTVLTAGSEENTFNIKFSGTLPKFVIAAIGINFTFFFSIVILDVAEVATHVVYGIPQSAGADNQKLIDAIAGGDSCNEEVKNKQVSSGTGTTADLCGKSVEKIKIIENGKSQAAAIEVLSKDEVIVDYGWAKITFKTFKFDSFNGSTIGPLFAYSVLNIQNLPLTSGGDFDIRNLLVKSVVALVVAVLILIVFTVMLFALIERIIIIWINIILSPVWLAKWILGGIHSKLELVLNDKYLGPMAFVKMAFLPAAMSVPLVFGLLMIQVGQTMVVSSPSTDIEGINYIISGVNSVHQLIWYLIAIAVLWSSVSVAESMTEATKGAITGIKSGVESFAGFVVKLPLYAPWIPVMTGSGNTENASAMAFMKGLGNIKQNVEARSTNMANKIAPTGSSNSDQFKSNYGDAASKMKDHDSGKWEKFIEIYNEKNGKLDEVFSKTASWLKDDGIKSAIRSDKKGAIAYITGLSGGDDSAKKKAIEISKRSISSSSPAIKTTDVSITAGGKIAVVVKKDETVTEVVNKIRPTLVSLTDSDKAKLKTELLSELKTLEGWDETKAKDAADKIFTP